METLENPPASTIVPYRPKFLAIWEATGDPDGGTDRGWSSLRSLYGRAPRPEFDALLCHLYDKFCTFGYIGLRHPDGFIENKQGVAILEHCLEHGPDEWTAQGVALVGTFWLLESAAVFLTEYNQRALEIGAIEVFLRTKLQKYRALALAGGAEPEGTLLALARQVSEARGAIPSQYVRSFAINGRTWEREERYLDGRVVSQTVYPVVCEEIKKHLGVDLPPAATVDVRFQKLVDLLVARSVNPFEILVAIVSAAVYDWVLDADYAVVTVPQGHNLDTPWAITIPDVCSHAVVREGFDPAAEGLDFTREQIVRTIEKRMRYNTACRSRNYHASREIRRLAQPFQFPDIAWDESSHHPGHIKTGINTSARTHFEVRIPSLVEHGEFRGFGDFRINRADNSPARQYSFDELSHLLPYGQWCKAVFDYAIGSNRLMDRKYCAST